MTTPNAKAAEIETFWRDAGRDRWFMKNEAFDREFSDRFTTLHFSAARRELDAWADTAQGSFALMILLDQFPRNCFRNTGHMYATDPLARHFARRAIAAGHDIQVEEVMRGFMYLPFSHSESLADQEYGLPFHAKLGAENMKHAQGHHDIVKRFGRFPHRNGILCRETTPEERAFLDEGGFSG